MARVLIVDDEAPIRKLLHRIVAGDGREVLEAATAEMAVELLAATPADVVLIDLQMPGKGGEWLCQRVRRDYPETAMILATGDASVLPATSMQSGITAYLTKPFNARSVAREVAAAIRWHEAAATRPAPSTPPAGALEDWLDRVE